MFIGIIKSISSGIGVIVVAVVMPLVVFSLLEEYDIFSHPLSNILALMELLIVLTLVIASAMYVRRARWQQSVGDSVIAMIGGVIAYYLFVAIYSEFVLHYTGKYEQLYRGTMEAVGMGLIATIFIFVPLFLITSFIISCRKKRGK